MIGHGTARVCLFFTGLLLLALWPIIGVGSAAVAGFVAMEWIHPVAGAIAFCAVGWFNTVYVAVGWFNTAYIWRHLRGPMKGAGSVLLEVSLA